MRKIIFFIFFLGCCFQTKAQMVVNDPTQTAINKAGWIESLTKTATQIQTLTESKNLLMQSINFYSKVSSSISNAKMVYDMIDRQVRLVTLVSKELSRREVQSPVAYRQYCSTMTELLETNKSNVAFLKTLVSPEVKMTDAERLRFIRDLNKDSDAILSDFFTEKDRFDELDGNLRIIKSLKSKKN